MKTNICLLLFFSFFTIAKTKAQSNDEEAVLSYQLAQEELDKGDYRQALVYLDKVDRLSEEAKVKTSYLRVRCYQNMLFTESTPDSLYGVCLKSIKFYLNNGNDSDKRKELIKLKLKIDGKMEELRVAQENLKKQESDAYTKVYASDVMADYEAFFQKYPNSEYKATLKAKYDTLKKEQAAAEKQKVEAQQRAEKEKADAEQRAAKETARANYLQDYKHYRKKGRRLVITGSIFLSGAVPLTIFGIQHMQDGTYDEYGYYQGGLRGLGITEVTLAGISFLNGIIMLPVGISRFGSSRYIKRKAENEGIKLAFYPQIDPFNEYYSAGFRMNF